MKDYIYIYIWGLYVLWNVCLKFTLVFISILTWFIQGWWEKSATIRLLFQLVMQCFCQYFDHEMDLLYQCSFWNVNDVFWFNRITKTSIFSSKKKDNWSNKGNSKILTYGWIRYDIYEFSFDVFPWCGSYTDLQGWFNFLITSNLQQ